MGSLQGIRLVASALRSTRSWPGYAGFGQITPLWKELPLRSPALGLPLPPITAELHVRTWAFRALSSSAVQAQSNAIRFPAETAFQWHSVAPHIESKSHFLQQAITPAILPILNSATSSVVQEASLKVPHCGDGAPLLSRPFSTAPGSCAPLLLHPSCPALSLPILSAGLPPGVRQTAGWRSFSSSPAPSEQQGWAQRLRSQTRSAVAQPRNVAAGVAEKGAAAFDSLTGAGARYRHALGLQVAGFWNRNSLLLYGALGLAVVLILWRVMFWLASIFLNFSEWMANLGFLALASSMVLMTGLYLRRRMSINPDSVYRQVMRQVNTFPSALEVLGAPLTGSDVRAYVMSGGGIRIRGLTPKFSTKRAYLIFPVRGSERRGLVSVEAKKRHGKYEFKLISVDVPTAAGAAEQRLYLVGDAAAYQKAGTLINELRDPIIKAMSMEHQFEEEDDKEDEEEARARRDAEAQQFQEQLAREADQLAAEAAAREQEQEAARADSKAR
ncbi:hypothetical protein KFL_005290030 [Klebsormidium nitens]|uniref:Uncharacterized protein n=1 Tax=Klebsormidium nitens TaxID=105231 RepID=A0A1Y1IMZ2_KLENI|nr:hypothetical protein KFL_005290030 [Klebsormidium nitens]|eukprot:GAQ89488.1 hypothetical protein KFL_005290030 [Klebsormidium nitens]